MKPEQEQDAIFQKKGTLRKQELMKIKTKIEELIHVVEELNTMWRKSSGK